MKDTDILLKVRNIINDLNVVGEPCSDDTDKMIHSFIGIALNELAASPEYIGPTSIMSLPENAVFNQRPDGMYYAEIKVPQDALRIRSVQLNEWHLPVRLFQPVVSTRFLANYSEVRGLGNGPKSPAAFVTTEGERIVIAHASKAKPTNYQLTYTPKQSFNEDGIVDIDMRYEDVIAYNAAKLYFNAIGELELSAAAENLRIQLINNL